MKKFISILYILIIAKSLFSQISIDQSDMPDVDDTIRSSVTIFTNVDYILTGANYTWDFSNLSPFSQKVDTFVSVWSTPLVYNVVFFYPLVATIAQPRPDNTNIPGFQFTDVYDFFKESSSNFALAGYGAKVNGIPVPVKYNNPDNLYHFPVTYGTVDSSESSFGQGISGLGYFGENKKRVNHVDGWGNLTTPYGTFQTIRIKSQISIFDTVFLDSLGFGLGVPRNITEYKWLAKGFGLPLLNISISGLSTTITYIDSVRKIVPGIHSIDQQTPLMSVYPNPASDHINLDIFKINKKEIRISFYNAMGQVIDVLFERTYNQNFHKRILLNDYKLKPGYYYLKMEADDYTISKTLIIQ